MTALQIYWWCLVSLLGSLLVFLMFVQGANVLLAGKLPLNSKRLIINATGRKWELTFTCLVTFGGAFFASFPLFYSTSFGGAYWVWILLLITFVFQAVSYEFQNKRGNLLGSGAFRAFLVANGILAPLVVGTAVGTFFTGSDFSVNKAAVLGGGGAISAWGSGWHGLEALASPALILGFLVLFLTICLGCLYVIKNVNEEKALAAARKTLAYAAVAFLVCAVAWCVVWFTMDGYAVAEDGSVFMEPNKYLHNLIGQWWLCVIFLSGVALIVLGLASGIFGSCRKGKACRCGIWPAGIGTVLLVMSVFLVAGLNGTAYYPSCSDLGSSLTIANSSSSPTTLKAMSYVSILIPFVLAYIVYAWRKMNSSPITNEEIDASEDKY